MGLGTTFLKLGTHWQIICLSGMSNKVIPVCKQTETIGTRTYYVTY